MMRIRTGTDIGTNIPRGDYSVMSGAGLFVGHALCIR